MKKKIRNQKHKKILKNMKMINLTYDSEKSTKKNREIENENDENQKKKMLNEKHSHTLINMNNFVFI